MMQRLVSLIDSLPFGMALTLLIAVFAFSFIGIMALFIMIADE